MRKEIEAEVVDIEVGGRSALNIYMQEIKNIPILTEEDNIELGKMLKNVETREFAKEKLIEGNLRLVMKLAHSWKGKGLGIDDLVSEGNAALVDAVEKFDIDCGKKFSTYALWWINVYMSRAVNSSHTIRIPDASALKKRNVNRFIASFKAEHGREPNVNEIKEGLGFSDIEMRNIFKLDNACISMNARFDESDEQSDEIGDILANQMKSESVLDMLVKNEDVDLLHKAINMLDEREKIVVKMRYGIDRDNVATLDEVAITIGKTKERVRQIQKVAEANLKKIMMNMMD